MIFWSLMPWKYTQLDGWKKNYVSRPKNLVIDKRRSSIEKTSWWLSIQHWIFAVMSKYNCIFFHHHWFLYNPVFLNFRLYEEDLSSLQTLRKYKSRFSKLLSFLPHHMGSCTGHIWGPCKAEVIVCHHSTMKTGPSCWLLSGKNCTKLGFGCLQHS